MVARIKIYDPNIKVTLYKTISRTVLNGNNPVSQRFQGTARTIDLTPFLGESSSVRTSKSVRDAAGGFVLSIADKPFKGNYAGTETFETLYGLIEPMDFIEIRMRHEPPTSGGTQPPIIMRGFVSTISRSEAMGSDGKPQRTVTVSGHDYGKLWQMLQILYLPGYVIGEDILSNFKLFERFGGTLSTLTAADFVAQIIQTIVNPYLLALMPANTPNPTSINAKQEIYVGHGVTSIQGAQNHEGTIYDLLKTYGDVGTWNELYTEDQEDGVYCVYRPIPSMDINGDLIQSDAPSPQYVDLYDVEVINLNVSRSDSNIANYYWVRAPRFDLVDSLYQQQFAIQGAAADTVLLGTYPNSSSKLYGTRVMYADTQQGGDDVTTFSSGQVASMQTSRNTSMANWTTDRRTIMVKQNQDNVLYESGTMRIRGNENIKAGMYVRLHRGTFTATYYVVQIDHDYLPFQGFFSTLTVERGTGFIERAQRSGGADSPYLAEMMETATNG